MPAVRLNKVLRELNISIDRAIDFLESKGHEIEKRPTSKISEEIYDLLCGEFQLDADNKVASKEVAEAQIKEKEELRIKREAELEEINKKKAEVITAASKVTKFKKLGKIDLEEKPKKQETKKEDDKDSKLEDTPKLKEEKIEEKIEEKKSDVDENKADNYKKLSGLKATGETLDLSKFKEAPSKKSEEEKPKSKKRRRRIIPKPSADNLQKKGLRGKTKGKKLVKEDPNEE